MSADPRLPQIHGYDDELARLDAVATVEALDRGDLSTREVIEATVARARELGPLIGAVVFERYESAVSESDLSRPRRGALHGLPTFIKDMVPVAGLPMTWGSEALAGAPPERRTGGVARDIERIGMAILGTSTMPEWGFIPSTEFPHRDPTVNPWNPQLSVGGSSGGAAALVAAGVVPIAHAVDGGGSTRIPAACAGLVGLKPTLGRLRRHTDEAALPLSISVDGVVTRTVRDTARWYSEVERVHRSRSLPPMGEVAGPPTRSLRVGVIGEVPGVATLDRATSEALAATAALLDDLGHHVEPIAVPVEPEQFRDDFIDYYRFLVFAATRTARVGHGAHFRPGSLTPFVQEMAASFRSDPLRVIGASRRLRRTRSRMAALHRQYDLMLSPALATVPPPLGNLSPDVEFEVLLDRIAGWMTFTPIANAAGTPAISLPMGFDEEAGVPVAAMLSADYGNDALLVQAALQIEQARPWDLARMC